MQKIRAIALFPLPLTGLGTSIIAGVVSLAACGSSGPTEAEMFEAMTNADQHRNLFGDPEKMMAETEKDGCEKMRENSYKCGISRKDGKGRVLPAITFTRVGDKWRLAK